MYPLNPIAMGLEASLLVSVIAYFNGEELSYQTIASVGVITGAYNAFIQSRQREMSNISA
jgi:hypothetical protein